MWYQFNVNIKFRSFWNLDEDRFHKDLRAVEWNEIKKLSDVNHVERFYDKNVQSSRQTSTL